METTNTEENEGSSSESHEEDNESQEIEELHDPGEDASADERMESGSTNVGEEQDKNETAESVDDNDDDTSAAELSSDDEARGFTDDAMVENVKVADILKMKTPKEVFDMFDEDKSGEIDEEEFLQALPKLKIFISKARAIKYFRKMDLDKSGAIGFDELQAILKICIPENGNTIGFRPNACKLPKCAFDYTDINSSKYCILHHIHAKNYLTNDFLCF